MKKILFIFLLTFIGIQKGYALDRSSATLKECIDGDTAKFIIGNKVETVRFLAIDTPETKHPTKGEEPFGKLASHFTCSMLQQANTIELAFEEKNRIDKYQRLLAWIFVDNKLLQDELIKKGYAKVAYLYDDYQYTTMLENHETEAKLNAVGMWNDQNIKINTFIELGIGIATVIITGILFFTNQKYRNKAIRKIKRRVKKKISH